MNKKILILVILSITLILPNVYSIVDMNLGLKHVFSFENNLNDTISSKYMISYNPTGYVSCGQDSSKKGIRFSGSNSWMNLTANNLYTYDLSTSPSMFCILYNATTTASWGVIMQNQYSQADTNKGFWNAVTQSPDKMTGYTDNTNQVTYPITSNAYVLECTINDGNKYIIFKNGTYIMNVTKPTAKQGDIMFNRYQTTYGTICYDEIYFWNDSNNYQERVTQLWNNGTFDYYPFYTGVISPNYTGLDSSQTNNTKEIILNVSCTSGNITLWFDNQTNPITKIINQNISPILLNFSSYVNLEQIYYLKGSCDNGINNGSVFIWTYDITSPNIYLNPNNFFNSNNNTLTNNYNLPFIVNITFNETLSQLYGYEINFTYPNGTVIYAIRNDSILKSNLTVSFILDPQNWTKNLNILANIWVSDYHTKKEIGNYENFKINNGVKFFRDTKEVSFYSTDKGDFKTEKFTDRYRITATFEDKKIKDREFYLETQNNIKYLPQSTYKGHFIIGDGIREGNWKDLENEENLSIEVYKISNSKYKIIIKNAPSEIHFNSIGGLNINHQQYTLFIGSYNTYQLPGPTFSGVNTTIYLNITKKANQNISPLFYYNYTYSNYTTRQEETNFIIFSKLITSIETNTDLNNTYVWVNNVSNNDNTFYLVNISNYHIIQAWGIDDCSIYNYTAFYINTFDESNGNNLITNGSFSFSFYLNSNPTLLKTYDIIRNTNNNTWRFCKYPNVSITGDINALISAGGYNSRVFYSYNSEFTGNFKSYLLPILSTNQNILFKLVDSSLSSVPNALFKIYKNINGSNELIYLSYTDFAGQVATYLDQLKSYNFIINASGYPLKTFDLTPTDPSLTYTIQLTKGVNNFANNQYQGVRFRVTPNSTFINKSNDWFNITFEVEGNNIEEIGINITEINTSCLPSNCFMSLNSAGKVWVSIMANQTTSFLMAFYFRQIGGENIYINHRKGDIVDFINEQAYNLMSAFTELKNGLSPNTRTLLTAGVSIIAVGISAGLGIYGLWLLIPVIFINIIFSLKEISFINPIMGIFISIVSIILILYQSMKEEG